MQNPNLGLLFYKDYFNALFNEEDFIEKLFDEPKRLLPKIKELNKKITETRLPQNNQNENPHSFELKTLYPGLLIGTGYEHEANLGEEEIKFGFHFDYASGLPVIPGSSVKGSVRSFFPLRERDEDLKGAKYNSLKNLFNKMFSNKTIDKEFIDNLENEIFEGHVNKKQLPVYDRDIFYDAVPIKSLLEDNRFLGNDYITPHGDNPFKDPIPLKSLKILPDVVYRFSFSLKDSKRLTAAEKLTLIKHIILNTGMGAKTNLNYGNFEIFNA